MRLRSHLVRLLLMAFVALFAAAPSGCVGCGGETESDEAHTLRTAFPEHAALVLDTAYALRAEGEGFALAPVDHERPTPLRGLEIRVPATGDDAVRFELDGGLVVKVHENGVTSKEGAIAGNAVAFAREGGMSYWAANDKGYEEWLHLAAGFAHGDKPAASWEIEGALLRQTAQGIRDRRRDRRDADGRRCTGGLRRLGALAPGAARGARADPRSSGSTPVKRPCSSIRSGTPRRR